MKVIYIILSCRGEIEVGRERERERQMHDLHGLQSLVMTWMEKKKARESKKLGQPLILLILYSYYHSRTRYWEIS